MPRYHESVNAIGTSTIPHELTSDNFRVSIRFLLLLLSAPLAQNTSNDVTTWGYDNPTQLW